MLVNKRSTISLQTIQPCLEPLNGHPEYGEEAGDDRDDKEAVDQGVLVAGNVEGRGEGDEPVQEEAEGEQRGGEDVGVGEEPVRHGLVDELGDEDDGRDDAGHEADRAHDDVEVGECHDCAVAEEAEEEEGEEGADTDYEMDCDHSHRTILTSVFTALFVI